MCYHGRADVAGDPDHPRDQQNVAEELKAGLSQVVLPKKTREAIDYRQSEDGENDWSYNAEGSCEPVTKRTPLPDDTGQQQHNDGSGSA